MKRTISIHLRIREHNESIWEVNSPFLSYRSDKKKISFDCFDSLFFKENNKEIYIRNVRDSIERFKNGESVTIFAYGQTGSGKTHTMLGATEDGFVQYAFNDIFPDNIQMSFIEIYNEKLFDLYLGTEVKMFSYDNKCVLHGMKIENVFQEQDARAFVQKCLENRRTSNTKFNSTSSRSHAVLQIRKKEAILTFIDLAGCERSSSNIARMKEAAFINKSLLSLGKLVNNMINNIAFGFRDSKLTRILQESILKKNSMLAFCMICPTKECLSESLGTINFAGRLSNLDVHIAKTEIDSFPNIKNEKIDFSKSESNKLNEEIIELQRIRIEELEKRVLELLKQLNDENQNETFLLEKQLFKMKVKSEKRMLSDEKEFFCTEDLLKSYLDTE